MASEWSKQVFSKNLKKYTDSSGKTQKELAEIVGVTAPTFNEWIKGKKFPRIDKVQKLADYFGIQKSDLIEDKSASEHQAGNEPLQFFDNLFPIESKRFPLLGEIACGKPIVANEERELYVEAGASIRADFCLRARGNSMIGARIHDGDIVFIQKQDMVQDGEIAAVIIDDEATLKRVNYYPERDLLILKAENSHYEDLIYSGEELNHIRILGRAVAFQSDIH